MSVDQRIVDGLAAQARDRAVLLAAGARHVGWKAGLGTAAAMAQHQLAAPLVGYLTDRTLRADGCAVDIGGWTAPRLEPEVALRLGPDGIADAVAPAIELVDLSGRTGVEAILAGNVFHRAFVIGDLTPLEPGGLEAVRLDVRVNGEAVAESVDPRTALGDLAQVLRSLAGQLDLAAGLAFGAGDVVITGSVIPALALARGADVAVTLVGSGSVHVQLR